MVDTATERRVLGLLGLGIRGRNVVVGVEQVRVAARKGRLVLAIVAPDASPNSIRKIVPLLGAVRVRMVQGPGAVALGSAVGRQSTAVIGVTDGALARGIRQLLERDTAPKDGAAGRSSTSAAASKGDRRIG